MTSSECMVQQLSKKCPGDHAHQHLVGGRCAAAAFYPLALVRFFLRGIRDTALTEQKAVYDERELMNMLNALSSGNKAFPLEAKLPEIVGPPEKVKTSRIKKTSGGYLRISYDNLKPFPFPIPFPRVHRRNPSA